jgi:DNA invertase Pin-like site-specific DNA recombinase
MEGNMKVDSTLIIKACTESASMAEAASKFDINFQTFRKYAKELGVWKPNQAGRGISHKKADGRDKYPLNDILNGKYPHYSSHKLRLRLIADGLKKDQCEECSIEDWNGKPLPKHLEHVDGNHYNHELSNLRILCPNCHQQTDTHGSKKLKMGR